MKSRRDFSGINLEYFSFHKLSGCYSTLQRVFFSTSVCILLFLSDDSLKKARTRTSKTISKYFFSGSNNVFFLAYLLMIVNRAPKISLRREKKGWEKRILETRNTFLQRIRFINRNVRQILGNWFILICKMY